MIHLIAFLFHILQMQNKMPFKINDALLQLINDFQYFLLPTWSWLNLQMMKPIVFLGSNLKKRIQDFEENAVRGNLPPERGPN